MNKNYSDQTTIYKSSLTEMYIFMVVFTFFFIMKKLISKNFTNIFFYQNYVHLGENTSTYCSRIIVVYVHESVVFSP